MKKIAAISLCLAIILMMPVAFVYGQIYTFVNSTSGAPSFVNSNATGSNIAGYGTSTNTPCAQGFSGVDGFNVTGYSSSNPSVGIVVKPKTGFKLSITGFTVRSRRSGTGPANIRLAYSLDNGVTWTDKGSNDAPRNGSCATSTSGTDIATWNVSLSVTNTTNGILFRVFPFGASSASGTIQIWGAFDINGTVDPVGNNCNTPVITPAITKVTCPGGNDGAINLAVAGTPPFTFVWKGPNSFASTLQNISGLKAGTYTVIATETTGGCKDTIDVVVTEATAPVPAVAVTANPGSGICAGSTVIFTAAPTNGGTTPAYQWKKNNINVGTNQDTYSDNTLATGDVVTCVMTSSSNCVSPSAATSNSVTMTVSPSLAPAVTISTNAGSIICAGQSVVYSATITNGGTAPIYQWQKNGNNVGVNSATYTDNALNNNDIISCVLTSNVCITPANVTSNKIAVTVNPLLAPSVSISTPSASVCAGSGVTFTAVPVNGGTTPIYQWKRNGVNTGSNSSSFSTTALANNDIVTCQLTTSEQCYTVQNAVSNSIKMTINPLLLPVINIASDKGLQACQNETIKFSATTINAGAGPVYQWKKNGIPTGFNAGVYIDANVSDKDEIVCVLTSNALCASPAVVSSNPLKMKIDTLQESQIFITSSSNDTICKDEMVNFSSYFINGGTRYKFQWLLNGVEVPGETSATFNTGKLNDGDYIQCRFTNGAFCPVPVVSSPINFTILQNHKPTVSIKSTWSPTAITFSATPDDAGSNPAFQWMKNYQDIPGAVNATYDAADLKYNDKIAVKMRTNLPCTNQAFAVSNVMVVRTGVAVEDVDNTAGIVQVYPNPNNGFFTLEYKSAHRNRVANISIVNLAGQALYSTTVDVHNGTIKHDVKLDNLSAGIYILAIVLEGHREYVRFSIVN